MHFFIYEIIILFLIPFALAKLVYRGLNKSKQLKYLSERFAIYSKDKRVLWQSRQTVWFHCVSVGETKAIFNLIEILLKQYPNTYFLISHGTLTGRNTRLPNNQRIHRTYLPYDTIEASKRFLSHFQPKTGLILETELWFNLINQCRLKKIPLHLINARLSKNSLKRYLPFKKFINSGLSQLNSIYVRAEEDLVNFKSLTDSNMKIMGNLKFEATPPKGIQEKILLKLVKKLNHKSLILIIVPRHPERFIEVEKIFQEQNLKIIRKSKLGDLKTAPAYILGDTMGDLYEIYGIANLAIIGGSILDHGGQNLIEPMSLNIQTAVGPSIYNFKDMVSDAEKSKAIFRFKDEAELERIIKNLLVKGQINQNILRNAQQYIKNSSGGTNKVIQLVNQYL